MAGRSMEQCAGLHFNTRGRRRGLHTQGRSGERQPGQGECHARPQPTSSAMTAVCSAGPTMQRCLCPPARSPLHGPGLRSFLLISLKYCSLQSSVVNFLELLLEVGAKVCVRPSPGHPVPPRTLAIQLLLCPTADLDVAPSRLSAVSSRLNH